MAKKIEAPRSSSAGNFGLSPNRPVSATNKSNPPTCKSSPPASKPCLPTSKPRLPTSRQTFEKIAPSAVEISVARNGSLKPYVACFQQLPDNIAREPLGMLAGVMTIGDRSENSSYIVNFLASLAKKEYYENPRRDAVESFEASLHKVNIGLAELAKEGNTEWIGTLDAAFCAVERNNLHFSVAGKARVLLFRDHHLSSISDGLVDESEDHPMKTFTDVASGKISSGDRILVTTPELFSALSEIEIERSGNRLPGEQFERFLRTAVVNKLDLSATILIDIGAVAEYRRPIAPKKTLATLETVPNAWSRAVFDASKQRGGSVEAELKEKKEKQRERIDDKTGHIYVTGETLDEERNETWERFRLFAEDVSRFVRRIGSLLGNRLLSGGISGMQGMGRFISRLFSALFASFRAWRQKRKFQRIIEKSQSKEIPKESDRTIEEKNDTESVPVEGDTSEKKLHSFVSTLQSILLSLRTRLRKKSVLLPFTVFLVIIILSFFFFRPNPPVPKEEPVQTTTQESLPNIPLLSNDKNIRFLENTPLIMNLPDILDIARIGDTAFFITKNAIYRSGKNGGDAIQVAYPDGSTAFRGVAMPDLNVVVILSESGKLFFFTPATNRFTEENAALSNPGAVADIAAVSTSLYVLNHEEDQLSRYSRTSDGFGAGTPWFKEPVAIEPNTQLAVSDSVFIADTAGLRVFFRGAGQSVSFESSATPVFFSDLFAENGSDSLFALDGENGRVVEYDAKSGAILNQYASDSWKGATRFTVDTASRTASVAANGAIFMGELR